MDITYNITDTTTLFNATMSIIEDGMDENEDNVQRDVTIYVNSHSLHIDIQEAVVLLSAAETLLPSSINIEASY